MNKKVLFITEYINPPYDEGIKKTVFNLYNFLDQNFSLTVISRKGHTEKGNIVEINTNRLFLSSKVSGLLRNLNPAVIIYLPFASATFAGFLRMWIFSRFHPGSKKILIALQPKRLKNWQLSIIGIIKPEIILTPSIQLSRTLSHHKIECKIIPLFTDTDKFKPTKEKSELRKKHNIPQNKYLITHIGHLNSERNLSSLIPIQSKENQVLIVGSTSTPADAIGPASIKRQLEDEGIIIIDSYVQDIEEIYQLSDLYIFPIVENIGSIGIPLSILEARACGISVLTTNFASIKHFLGEDYGGISYSDTEHFSEKVEEIKRRNMQESESVRIKELNDEFYSLIINSIREPV